MSNLYSRVIIIFNPNSTGEAPQMAKELETTLRKKLNGTPVELCQTTHAGHGEQLAYDAAIKYQNPLIVSCSGDGGYHEVINGAIRAQREGASPVCLVAPAGNANDHHRTLAERGIVEAIVRAELTQIDLIEVAVTHSGKTDKRLAHSYAGLGLTPTVAVELNRHTLNRLKEAWLVLKTFWRYRPFRIKVGGVEKELNSLVFANISQMAKVVKLSPDGDPTDGLFEIIEYPHWSKWAFIKSLLRSLIGRVSPPAQATEFSFITINPQPMQIDGEVQKLKAGSSVAVKLLPQVLSTFL